MLRSSTFKLIGPKLLDEVVWEAKSFKDSPEVRVEDLVVCFLLVEGYDHPVAAEDSAKVDGQLRQFHLVVNAPVFHEAGLVSVDESRGRLCQFVCQGLRHYFVIRVEDRDRPVVSEKPWQNFN